MSLSNDEIDQLIEKLRARYVEYSEKFDRRWFNVTAFEERLVMAVKNSMNLEAFILAEISNFEKVKEKYDKKKKERPFSEKIDRIIDEQSARIKKYREIKFHPNAGFEISHFYGALSELALYHVPLVSIILTDKHLKDQALRLEDKLNVFSLPRGDDHSQRVEDHILVLGRSSVNDIEIEKDRNNFLKESAFVLHEIVDFCDGLIESRNQELENPLRFDKMFLEESRKKKITELFSGLTGYGAILKVKELTAEIIEDFRLGAFKKDV